MVYLDNAATTRVSKAVLDAMLPYFDEYFGNPDSVHDAAKKPLKAIENADAQIRRNLIHTSTGKIIFTSGGTESNNMAINLYNAAFPIVSCLVTSATEHKSVLVPASRLVDMQRVTILHPGSAGAIRAPLNKNIMLRESVISPECTLFSFMHMNNETGVQNDVYAIGKMLRRHRDVTGRDDTFLHVDCVQSAGELPIYAEDMCADMISVSAHKIHGPKGSGCLWVSDRLLNRMNDMGRNLGSHVRAIEMIIGGGQQDGWRAGTLNVPGIVGLGAAVAQIDENADWQKVSDASNAFADNLVAACSSRGAPEPVFHFGLRSKNSLSYASHDRKILSIGFPGADAETVVMIASRNGLCVSNGAACNSVSSEPSYVLTESGIDPDMARSTIRVSFSKYNTVEECLLGAEILAESVKEAVSLTDFAP